MTTAITTPQDVAQASTAPQTVTIGSSSDFSTALLEALGLPVTAANVGALNAWQAAEGQWTATGDWNPSVNHNPLNLEGTTIGHPNTASGTHNADPTNPINLYPDWTTGIQATADRINANPGIVAALRAGGATPALLSAAVRQSGWGTGDFSGGSTASQSGTGGPQTATLDVALGADITKGIESVTISPFDEWISGGKVKNPVAGISSVTDFLRFITSVRFIELIGGVLLIGLGTAIFLSSTKPGQEAISLAPALAAA